MKTFNRVALYARVSTRDQDPTNQLLDLRANALARGWTIAGEYVDIGISGSKDNRPQLNALMNLARKRKLDAVFVWRFDRFARSSQHLLRALEEFRGLGIDFVSYQENLDTSSPLGQAIFTIVGAVAQLERDIIKDRVNAGLRRARSLGKTLGRPQVSFNRLKALELKATGLSNDYIGQQLGVSRETIRKAIVGPANNPPVLSPVD